MTPIEYYQKAIESGEIINDPKQWVVLTKLQQLYLGLAESHSEFAIAKLKRWIAGKAVPKSLYIWGSVGAGKTFLMNAFFHCLPFTEKRRWHYVEFMAEIHRRLTALKGQANPLDIIAKELAKQYRIICLDEFIVVEIADAMILAKLIAGLLANRCVLVFTSNVVPKELYKNGLQREQFLPAIELIEKKFDVVELTLNDDFRLRNNSLTNFYISPDGANLVEMEERFATYAKNDKVTIDPVIIADHSLLVHKRAGRIIWCEFSQICHPPRSQFDYLELINQFDVILISHVQAILPHQHDIARLFIKLVDVIYDNQKQLIIASQVPVEAIYISGLLAQEFQRTKSRLIELISSSC